MITLPYIDIDDGKNYQGLVFELIQLFGKYHQFDPQYDNVTYQNIEHPFVQSQIVDKSRGNKWP